MVRFVLERVLTPTARDTVNGTNKYNTLICAVSHAEQRYTIDTRYIYHRCLCPAVNTGWDQAAMFPRWCGNIVTLILRWYYSSEPFAAFRLNIYAHGLTRLVAVVADCEWRISQSAAEKSMPEVVAEDWED